MKINNTILTFNYTNQNNLKSQDNKFVADMDFHNVLNPAEVLGRSQVVFGNNDFKLNNDDKKFVNVVAKNLRLSGEEANVLNNTVKNFLKYNGFTSLYDIAKDDDYANQAALSSLVSDALDLSDMDLGILMDDLYDRLYFEDEYIPIEKKYKKDFEVVDHILSKYDIDRITMGTVFDLFVYESQSMNYDSVFDIFKPGNNPERSFSMTSLRKNLGEDTALDLLIDFGIAALKDPKTRHGEINKHKLMDKYCDEEVDYEIALNIIEHFNLDDGLDSKIAKAVAQFYTENKDVKLIAFELADKYNLPPKAEKYIEEVIVNYNDIKSIIKK